MLLEMLKSHAPEEMPKICAWANGAGALNDNLRSVTREWLDAVRWDTFNKEDRWLKQLKRCHRQEVLDGLQDVLRGVSLSLEIANEGRDGPATRTEVCQRFGLPLSSRTRRAKRRVSYVTAVFDWQEHRPQDPLQKVALFTLWLLDDPKQRGRLRRCAKSECNKLFWCVSGTKLNKFCPYDGCKRDFFSKKRSAK